MNQWMNEWMNESINEDKFVEYWIILMMEEDSSTWMTSFIFQQS